MASFRLWAVVLLLAMVGAWTSAEAQLPRLINYQGFLTEAGNVPANGTKAVTFKLYGAPVGGVALHSETQSVTVVNGVFNAAIGSITPLVLLFDVPYYLSVTIAADPEMTPRQPLLASPYSLRTAAVDAAAALPAAQITGTLATAQIADGAVSAAKLSTSGCAAGQVLKFNGTAWGCATDAAGSGTVTSIDTGSGLTGGPITSTGTMPVISYLDAANGVKVAKCSSQTCMPFVRRR